MPILRSRNRIWKPQPLDNDNRLVGWWPFDDGVATDISGYGCVGQLTASPPPVLGPMAGIALSFNGTTQYITVQNPASVLNVPFPFSISFWCKYTTSGNTVIFENNGNSGFSVQTNGTGIGANVGGVFNVAGVFNDGNWHHCVLVVSSAAAGGIAIYKDGLVVGTVQGGTPTYGGTVYIGGRATTAPFPGSLDDLRLYKLGLSPAEINALYNQPLSMYCRQDEWEMPPMVAPSSFPWWAVNNNPGVIGTGLY